MENVSSAYRVPGNLCDNWLGKPTDLYLKIQDVKTSHTLLGDLVVTDVAVIAPYFLVAA
jgi:hypothetical protein